MKFRLKRFSVPASLSFALVLPITSFALNNIQKAKTVLQGISERKPALATKYINAQKFVNHDLAVGDGVPGLRAYIAQLSPASSPIQVIRAFQDGSYVVTHSQGDLSGQKVFFDIFKFEDGEIVEHWNNITDLTSPNESGNTPTDGPTEIEDRDETGRNKTLVTNFYEGIYLQGQLNTIAQYFDGNSYIRHDSRGGNGLPTLIALIQQGTSMSVSQIHVILGEGNFVLVVAEGLNSGQSVAYYDLFRVENNKIAEHWDVIQNIPPQDQWKNQNGKFGFNNIDKAESVLQGISDRDPNFATIYINAQKFVNHDLDVGDGVPGLRAYIAQLPPASSPIQVIRAFQDGSYVVTHSQGDLSGQKVFFDIFKFEDGEIVEHWNNITDLTPPNESGNTPTNGPTKIEDRDETRSNKTLVTNFYEGIYLQGQLNTISQYFDGNSYIRHDSRGGDGLPTLIALIQQGTSMSVSQIHVILGKGNFVLVVAEGLNSGQSVAYYDLFRVENNKIAEHWDVIQNIPLQDQWKNQHGKF